MGFRNNNLSALIASFITLALFASTILFRPYLSGSREGNLIAGVIGSLVFTYTLTAISNLKMASAGASARSGLFEVFLSMLVAMIAAGLVHRVAITLCLLFSFVSLFFLTSTSRWYYQYGTHQITSSSGAGIGNSETKKRR